MTNAAVRDLDLQALPKVLTERMLMRLSVSLKHGKVEMDALQKVLKKKDMIEVISYAFNYATNIAAAAYDVHYDSENAGTVVKDVDELCRICGLSEEVIAETKKIAASMG